MFLALGILMPDAVPNQNGRVFVYRLGGTAELPATPAQITAFPAPPAVAANEETLAKGRDLFGYFCWQCHGANAVSSGVIPDLRRSALLHSPTGWSGIVLDGALEDNGMGAFGEWLSNEDAAAIREFVAFEAARVRPPADSD